MKIKKMVQSESNFFLTISCIYFMIYLISSLALVVPGDSAKKAFVLLHKIYGLDLQNARLNARLFLDHLLLHLDLRNRRERGGR